MAKRSDFLGVKLTRLERKMLNAVASRDDVTASAFVRSAITEKIQRIVHQTASERGGVNEGS